METKTYEQVLAEDGVLYWHVKGVSMLPLIRQGHDIIRIEPLRRAPAKYDVVLFRRREPTGRISYVLHRIVKLNPDGTCWIVGDNTCSGDTVRREDMIGILSALVRNGKTLRMDGPAMKLYGRFWGSIWPERFFFMKYRSLPKRALKKLLRHIPVKNKK